MLYLYISDESLRGEAAELIAITQEVHVITELPKDVNTYLQLDQNGLAIVSSEFKLTYVKDLYSKLWQRLKTLNQELLIQAMKIKGLNQLNIWDITAGLGRDAILLANAGHKVTMVERNPLLALILNYIIKNKILPGTDNLNLVHIDSIDYLLQNHNLLPNVIYLDPMFQDNSSAKSKKDMQIVELLLHATLASELSNNNRNNNLYVIDENINLNKQSSHCNNFIASNNENINLFYLAYKTTFNKVVVKRDNKQIAIVELPVPNYNKLGKTIRYDVYLK